MTTNSPNPVDGDVQALIYRCKDAVAHLSQMVEAGIRGGRYSVTEYRYQLMINKTALAALEAEPVAWVVMAPQGDYIERNPEVVAHLEGTGLAKCKPLYDTPSAQLLRPVELPEPFYGVVQDGKPVMIAADDGQWINKTAVIEALRQQGYEVKND
ncbi:hypothetical protein [Pantoea ananatis]|uniref:hypothetical protein n=1 Tax=Pantoea ananas TaxID=553 RepID=UPI001B316122|nr:hypothetical protein [Pantoea ananatis]